MRKHPIGIYEKALPKESRWSEKLAIAKAAGFDFVEMSIDETDERLARLDWTQAERLALVDAIQQSGVRIPTMCLSGHRRFPFGSHDADTRKMAHQLMEKAIKLAQDLGIRTIQLAGYDVYYEQQDAETIKRFEEAMLWVSELAAASQVMCAVEIMDTPFMNSITKWQALSGKIRSPWFTVYPDVGNLTAWGNDVENEFLQGIEHVVALHLKDTYAVTETCKGQFRDVPFGEGCVDFVNLFKLLKRLNYRGTFLIEMWTEKADEPLVEIIKARHWIEDKMQQAGWHNA
ncbi:L-ribulose-5-phosphate 3-epimerase [Providencia heimbachae]|uniref:L-ribulose-5-phosphate 3-epimerase n=1 Tax=Providencia heimbachae ATCC 35613 TaxID=1354272 RepID=A0A1B7JWG4_9GAMM|nr:L-ribulose-5-phosphate 3-epimerase [Providencia heimbachae]OAT52238.1 putative hexulose-6-phosphate isomerase [Providencia heimbachae ATCC 35613]SQH15062.1 L-ribulose-5-phosphate 3-epimerase ulaE [Providencia heimbachae]